MPRRMLPLVIALLLGALAAPAAAQQRAADLRLRLWPSPSVVVRGDTVKYEIAIDNQGDGKASRTRVTLPFPKGQLIFAKVELLERTTWVMELADDKIVIMFGTLRSGEERVARVFFTVTDDAQAAPDGAQFRLRASARWDEDEGTRLRSNETLVTIAGAADTTPGVTVEPASAPAGTVLHFTVQNYYPEEKIFTWLNAPGGVALPSGIHGRADEQGHMSFELKTGDLEPGAYSLVVLGDTSEITTVTPFEVK